MKLNISNEVKIGILGIVTLTLLIFGFKYLKGNNLLDKSKSYYIYYDYVDMLETSSPVLIRGIKVGSVIKIELDPTSTSRVQVTIDIRNGIKLPQNTTAVLKSAGLMGGKVIELVFDHHCMGEDCIPEFSIIKGASESILGTMFPKGEMVDYIQTASREVRLAFDSITDPGASSQLSMTIKNLNKTIYNINSISEQISKLLDASSKHIHSTLQSTDVLTSTLAKNSNSINRTVTNLEQISEEIKKSEPTKLVNKLDLTVDESKKTIAELNKMLSESQKSFTQLNQMITQVNSGQGTLGKLNKDQSLYTNLDKTSKNMELLLQDIRLNPQRYIHVSVFRGKGDRYVLPENDPADPEKQKN